MARIIETENIVREKLASDLSLKQLRLTAFDNLEIYWRAFYHAIYIKHPNYISLVAALMTQDTEKSGSLVNGPLPVFYSLNQESRKKWQLSDYRQLNDQRVAIVSIENQDGINEGSLAVLMDLNRPQLESLNRALPALMQRFVSAKTDEKLIKAWQEEVSRNDLWSNDGALEFNPETLATALEDLGTEFLLESSNAQV